jgi:hypothetical protein
MLDMPDLATAGEIGNPAAAEVVAPWQGDNCR